MPATATARPRPIWTDEVLALLYKLVVELFGTDYFSYKDSALLMPFCIAFDKAVGGTFYKLDKVACMAKHTQVTLNKGVAADLERNLDAALAAGFVTQKPVIKIKP